MNTVTDHEQVLRVAAILEDFASQGYNIRRNGDRYIVTDIHEYDYDEMELSEFLEVLKVTEVSAEDLARAAAELGVLDTSTDTCDLCEEYATQQFEQGGECHTLCDACEKETRPEECAHDNVDALGDEVWCEDCGEGLDSWHNG